MKKHLALFVVAVAFGGHTTTAQQGAGLQLTVLSGRPDMVSGGDALIRVAVPGGAAPTVSVEGRDVSSAFRKAADADGYVGLVEGLSIGRNTVMARAGTASGQITLTNHPITGPITSGPQMTPFICTTEEVGLGAPLDASCSART